VGVGGCVGGGGWGGEREKGERGGSEIEGGGREPARKVVFTVSVANIVVVV